MPDSVYYIGLALGLLLILFLIFMIIRDRNHRMQIAKAFGLQIHKDKINRLFSYEGSRDGYNVNLYERTYLDGEIAIDVFVFKLDFSPEEIEKFTVQLISTLPYLKRKRRDMETNDQAFDKKIFIDAFPRPAFFAWFSPVLRRKVYDLFKSEGLQIFSLREGKISFQFSRSIRDKPADYLRRWDRIKEICARFSGNISVDTELRNNYFAEKTNGGRIAYLGALGWHCYKLEKDDPVIKDAFKSANPSLMLQAVRYTGEPHYSYLPDIYMHGASDLRIETLEFAIENDIKQLAEYFLKNPNITAPHKEKELMLDLISQFDFPGAEDFLTVQIKEKGLTESEYEKRCIILLGRYGTYPSINFLNSIKTVNTARIVDTAINQIQDRVGSGESGWLSSPEEEQDSRAGALSIDFEKKEE